MARCQRWQLQASMEQVDNQVALLRARVATLRSKEATFDRARSDLSRAQNLLNRAAIAREEFDQRRESERVAEAQVIQAREEVSEVRVGLGLAPWPEKGKPQDVPVDLNQVSSAVRQALANLIQSWAQDGLPLASSEDTPRRREQFHTARLNEWLDPLNPSLGDLINQIRTAHQGLTVDPSRSSTMAWQLASDPRDQQAASLSYFDCFWAFAMLALVVIPLAFFLRPAVARKGAHMAAESLNAYRRSPDGFRPTEAILPGNQEEFSMRSLSVGLLLLILVGAFTSISPWVFDFGETHMFNDRWPPHAKFHNAQTLLMGTALGLLTVAFSWRGRREPERRLQAACLSGTLY